MPGELAGTDQSASVLVSRLTPLSHLDIAISDTPSAVEVPLAGKVHPVLNWNFDDLRNLVALPDAQWQGIATELLPLLAKIPRWDSTNTYTNRKTGETAVISDYIFKQRQVAENVDRHSIGVAGLSLSAAETISTFTGVTIDELVGERAAVMFGSLFHDLGELENGDVAVLADGYATKDRIGEFEFLQATILADENFSWLGAREKAEIVAQLRVMEGLATAGDAQQELAVALINWADKVHGSVFYLLHESDLRGYREIADRKYYYPDYNPKWNAGSIAGSFERIDKAWNRAAMALTQLGLAEEIIGAIKAYLESIYIV